MSDIPEEVLDLVRFFAKRWREDLNFVMQNCDSEVIGKYPMVQGTRNHINLDKIGSQEFDVKNIPTAIKWLCENPPVK